MGHRRSAASRRRIVSRPDAVVRSQLERFRGKEVTTTGDGFLAIFDGPARAVRCASEIAAAVRSLGIEIRAGLHTGEIEVQAHRSRAWPSTSQRG